MVELMWQLQGRATGRQAYNPRIGVAQCTDGGAAVCVVSLVVYVRMPEMKGQPLR